MRWYPIGRVSREGSGAEEIASGALRPQRCRAGSSEPQAALGALAPGGSPQDSRSPERHKWIGYLEGPIEVLASLSLAAYPEGSREHLQARWAAIRLRVRLGKIQEEIVLAYPYLRPTSQGRRLSRDYPAATARCGSGISAARCSNARSRSRTVSETVSTEAPAPFSARSKSSSSSESGRSWSGASMHSV